MIWWCSFGYNVSWINFFVEIEIIIILRWEWGFEYWEMFKVVKGEVIMESCVISWESWWNILEYVVLIGGSEVKYVWFVIVGREVEYIRCIRLRGCCCCW